MHICGKLVASVCLKTIFFCCGCKGYVCTFASGFFDNQLGNGGTVNHVYMSRAKYVREQDVYMPQFCVSLHI